MSKKFDNRKLLIILSGLLVVLLLTVIIKMPRERSTLKSTLVELDTASVGEIVITPKSKSSESFRFSRDKTRWNIIMGEIVAKPTRGAVKNIMSEILSIKPKSLAAVGESRWKEYELTDSLATKVTIRNSKGKELAGLFIGKFSYRQAGNPYGGYGGNNIEGTTYVRLDGEKEI